MNILNKKKTQLILIISFLLGLIITINLFIVYLNPIKKTILEYEEGIWFIIIIISVRMGLLLLMSIYLFKSWFDQENYYFSDIPFLFGIFFMFVFFGKLYDLLHNLTYHFIDNFSFLIILKIRFLIGILSITPMYYLSIGMIIFFFSLSEKYPKFNDKEFSDRIQLIILILIILIETIIIILFLNVGTNVLILPGIVIPSFLIIVLVFFFAYKNQRLSQVNPLILTVGFAAYLISQVIRPIFHGVFGEEVLYILFSELIDLIIFFIIFIGLIKK